MYPDTWPIGTLNYRDLPVEMQASMSSFVLNGIVDESFPVQNSATEGPFINFAGYKVRVMIENTSPTTFIVRLA